MLELELLFSLALASTTPAWTNEATIPIPTESLASAHHIEFTQGQIFILYGTGAGVVLVILGGAILTLWCRRSKPDNQTVKIPGDEDSSEISTYEIDHL
jgi:hypothetical protein